MSNTSPFYRMLFSGAIVLIFSAIICIDKLGASEFRPTAVTTTAQTSKGHEIGSLYDGRLDTTTILLDETRTGKNAKTNPPNGSIPVTATFIIDLGQAKQVCGIRFIAANSPAAKMARSVSVYAVDDPNAKINVRPLVQKKEFLPVIYSNSVFATWKNEITTRFLAVKIEDAYERPDNIPVIPRNRWFQGAYRSLQAGYGFETSGAGNNFLTEIAEITCFDKIPDDFDCENPPELAFPESRLHRDWILRDCGLDYVKALKSMSSDQMRDFFQKCKLKRQKMLQQLVEMAGTDRFIYTKHTTIGGATMHAGTENLTDTQYDEWNPDWRPGGKLCMLTVHKDGSISNEVLLETKEGFIRDPDLSFDGKTLVFSMRRDHKSDDFHLYTMDLATRTTKQITFSAQLPDGKNLPCGDTEPCFAPDGGIIFQSTRCEQIIPCWMSKVSNLYKCRPDGSGMYRIGFDQVNTYYPKVLDDGRIIYTRWEYNDRDSSFTQALFTMNADGTSQLGYYGNSSHYPVSIFHARGIPGSSKVIALAAGHYVLHKGKLIEIDRRLGSQEDSGIEYIAGSSPEGTSGRWKSKIVGDSRFASRLSRVFFGQFGPQYQSPFAFDEDHFLVSYLPEGSPAAKGPYCPGFGVYFMTADGQRELLAFDPTVSCSQAIPVVSRACPNVRQSTVDHRKSFGQFFIQNVDLGLGMAGMPKGSIDKIRVVALEYRSCWIGGEGRTCTQKTLPYSKYTDTQESSAQVLVSVGGTWDVKHVLGEAKVEKDGSCFFEVPANNPVYFQLLDKKGHVVQSMRSWTMLLPGEQISCVGCHEDKNEIGVTAYNTRAIATQKPVQELQPIQGTEPHPLLARLKKAQRDGLGLLSSSQNYLGVNEARYFVGSKIEGFSYTQNIQPIWDRHCIVCHTGDKTNPDKKKASSLSLKGQSVPYTSRAWLRNFSQSYLALVSNGKQTPLVNWISSCAVPELIPPKTVGSIQSKLMDYLEPTHYDVRLTDTEKRLVACWIDLAVPFCGSYDERNLWNDDMKKMYQYHQDKRRIFAEQEIDSLKRMKQEREKP